MSRHINIPIFIPHLGCPNQCVFCNQRTISGVTEFDPSFVSGIIDSHLATADINDEVEIAFFGGSFTGIDRSLMIELLEIAYGYVKSGAVRSIRCSTRPDYIDEEILSILTDHGVKHIELGLQSTSDKVLRATKRGHDRNAEEIACKMIVEHGFELIGQMMIGLPEATIEDELETARFIINCKAKGARIYPTVVFKDTELCEMAASGDYQPLSIEEAVERSAKVYSLFSENKLDVIRIGLCSSENLTSYETYYGGPNHPAIGEMVLNKFYYEKIYGEAVKLRPSHNDILKINVATGALSKAIGQKKINKYNLRRELCVKDIIFVECNKLSEHEITVEIYSGEK